jgi:peptide/nickel transport system substrate-binding protein
VKVRQALAYAFDYNALVKDIMRGMVNGMRGPVLSAIWKYDGSYPEYTHNMKKAKRLLAEAGYPNGGFTLTFVVETGGYMAKNAALVLQQSAKPLGIQIKLHFLSWTTIWAMMAKEDEAPDIFDTSWYADYADPQNFLESQYDSAMFGNKGFNESYYANPKVDRLLAEARFMPDRKQRKARYAEAIRQIMKDCPAIWAAERLQTVSVRSWIKGYVLNPIYYEMPCFYGVHRYCPPQNRPIGSRSRLSKNFTAGI